MKMFIMLIAVFSLSLCAQEFQVSKVSGDVKVLRGTSEEWKSVEEGQTLLGSDLVQTGAHSFIQLNRDGAVFMLKGDAALGLGYIREVTLNELLLALATEEIRNIPTEEGSGGTRTTAVYGEDKSSNETADITASEFGRKKLNGARILAETGFQESALIVAAETYRKYPVTKTLVEQRLYFADILIALELFDEAFRELHDIQKYASDEASLEEIQKRMESVKKEMVQ